MGAFGDVGNSEYVTCTPAILCTLTSRSVYVNAAFRTVYPDFFFILFAGKVGLL